MLPGKFKLALCCFAGQKVVTGRHIDLRHGWKVSPHNQLRLDDRGMLTAPLATGTFSRVGLCMCACTKVCMWMCVRGQVVEYVSPGPTGEGGDLSIMQQVVLCPDLNV